MAEHIEPQPAQTAASFFGLTVELVTSLLSVCFPDAHHVERPEPPHKRHPAFWLCSQEPSISSSRMVTGYVQSSRLPMSKKYHVVLPEKPKRKVNNCKIVLNNPVMTASPCLNQVDLKGS